MSNGSEAGSVACVVPLPGHMCERENALADVCGLVFNL